MVNISKQKREVSSIELTKEQDIFLRDALSGHNVLVDACVGSGKTTAIQALCDAIPSTKRVLYLTYSRLLKIDAQSKIKNKNATVQNYHGFAYRYTRVAPQESIKKFLSMKPEIEHYDLLVLDEYQDIDQEIADMLIYIKGQLPQLQVVAVGDMQQKVSDKTKIDANNFMKEFLGKKHTKREFTICFRLNQDHANMLSRVWAKPIIGANQNCIVEHMTEDEVFALLLDSDSRDILCLGSRTGGMSKLLNVLEDAAGYKFNKNTVYASIRDRDSHQVDLDNDVAIFTTFDSCKGLERKICVVFDFEIGFWNARLNKPDQSYEILRNIFCVAASRGKDKIIFVKGRSELLDEKTLAICKDSSLKTTDYAISDMFDFKYTEDIDRCFSYLNINEVTRIGKMSELEIKRNDGLIDISPCIGIFQEASFFDGYCIDKAIENHLIFRDSNDKEKSLYNRSYKRKSLEEKILFLSSLETKQERYRTQVQTTFIANEDKEIISNRLSTHFSQKDEVQAQCELPFFISNADKKSRNELSKPYFYARGLADVVKNKTVYELKFVSHIDRTHFLQLACYIVALGLKKGRLINILDNRVYDVTVSNKSNFLEAVAHAITKQRFAGYKMTTGTKANDKVQKHIAEVKRQRRSDAQYERWERQWREENEARKKLRREQQEAEINRRLEEFTKQSEERRQQRFEGRSQLRELAIKQQRESIKAVKAELAKYSGELDANAVIFALIDVETSFAGDVISIGVVISDDISFRPRDFKYYRILEHEKAHAMYAYALELEDFALSPNKHEIKLKYLEAIDSIQQLLSDNTIKNLFAYNANFDKRHLPELASYRWHDIIEKAAYKQCNKKIPKDSEFWGTGRLKKGFGVEAMYHLLTENSSYRETHNALMDALDELVIMKFLNYRVISYGAIK